MMEIVVRSRYDFHGGYCEVLDSGKGGVGMPHILKILLVNEPSHPNTPHRFSQPIVNPHDLISHK